MSVLNRPFATGSNNDSNRELTAYHEGSHGVTAAALRCPFRYITMRPRSRNLAGAVKNTRSTDNQLYRLGKWREDAAWSMASAVIEDLWYESWRHDYLTDVKLQAKIRRGIVQYDCGHDLKIARDSIKYAWAREAWDPGWASTPINHERDTVKSMAIDAWQLAVWTVARYWSSIDVLAQTLLIANTAVQWSTVRDLVSDEGPNDNVELPIDYIRPWFLEHSRLRWDPSPRWYADTMDYAERCRVEREEEASCLTH